MRRHDLDKYLPIGEAYRACRDRSTSGARTSTGERFLNTTQRSGNTNQSTERRRTGMDTDIQQSS